MTIQGSQVECDTPQEAAALLHSFARGANQERVEKPQEFHSKTHAFTKGKLARQQSMHSLYPSKGEYIFKKSQKAVLETLKSAYPDGVTSDDLASRTGMKKTSLPIIMVGLRTFAKKRGIAFDDLIRRSETPLVGMRGSVYTLTEKGLKEFFG
jgi:hypothetical protein